MMCCEQGDSEMAKLLLDSQANPNLQQSNTGYTALMFACKGGHLDTVKVLMEHGADPLIRNSAGVTALGVASANEFPDVCNELNHWGQPDSTTDVEHPETSTAKEEVDEVVSRFRQPGTRGRGGGKEGSKRRLQTILGDSCIRSHSIENWEKET
ncbi:Putative ankyrin repeat protein RF_1099 [Geodia barretti]|uniref:Ankyrin repeat protein RF_1099 n=1 Tax=Geodia barretti TaxID=519541 RepID=A0AA35S8Q8_GEOBA|nr:Putative ankyrin repeat protein RF_1099 [Geodia barretti]